MLTKQRRNEKTINWSTNREEIGATRKWRHLEKPNLNKIRVIAFLRNKRLTNLKLRFCGK